MEAAFGYKTCPRCGEKLFDDMETCYGCLYRFKEPPASGAAPEPEPKSEPGIYDVEEPDYLCEDEPPAPLTPTWAVRVKTALSDTLLPVSASGLLVGRAGDCDVVLHQRSISEKHLRLTPAPDGVEFQDLGSTNPALYRSEPICDAVLVGCGNAVELCGAILEVERAP